MVQFAPSTDVVATLKTQDVSSKSVSPGVTVESHILEMAWTSVLATAFD